MLSEYPVRHMAAVLLEEENIPILTLYNGNLKDLPFIGAERVTYSVARPKLPASFLGHKNKAPDVDYIARRKHSIVGFFCEIFVFICGITGSDKCSL